MVPRTGPSPPNLFKPRLLKEGKHSHISNLVGNPIEIFAMYQCTYCDYKSLRLWCINRHSLKKHQHLRKYHGLRKYKCDHCDYRTNDQINKIKYQKAKHANILLKCKLCEYNTQDRSNLIRHVRKKHNEMKIKCKQCDFFTDRDDNMKRHVIGKQKVKICKTKSLR